jgi:hypothetical protein
VGVGVAVGLGVGDAATTLKCTVIEGPLVPVPPMELHGVATNVWVPIAFGVHVKSKGVTESVLTLPSLLNTTLCVYAFGSAVTVQLVPRIRLVPSTKGLPPLYVNPLNSGVGVGLGVAVGVGIGVDVGVAVGVAVGVGVGVGVPVDTVKA